MGTVVDLAAWRAEREPEARLSGAMDGLEEVLRGREHVPEWASTEMLAALGCRHLGRLEEAAARLERAAERLRREDRRSARRARKG